MRRGNCVTCNADLPLAQLRAMDGKIYCDPCVTKTAESGQHGEIYRISDPTICTKCNTDWGNNDLPKVGGLPYCSSCRERLYNYPFPSWLKIALVAAMLLLAVSLVHGTRYFRLGRDYYRGQRQLKARQYAAAAQSMAPVAEAAPNCEECVLLLAKAHLLDGHPELAWNAAKKYHDGHFQINDQEKEVEALFNRYTMAADSMEAAQKLYLEHKEQESLKALEKAASAYPEWPIPRQQVSALKVAIAFDHKDYDQFLSLAQESYRTDPKSPDSVAQVASALACKYAVTGEPQFLDESHKYLAEAKELATTKEGMTDYQEYAERIEHRLQSREIISREEYNRRYRPNAQPEEAAK